MRCLWVVILVLCCTGLAHGQQPVITRFEVQGNTRLKTQFIKRISYIEAGKPLDSLLIAKDISRIKRLPAVAHAYFKVLPDTMGLKLHYHIEENFTLIPSINIYTTTNDEFAYRLGLNEFNLLGQNIGLGGFYQKDIFDSYGLALRAPFLFTKHLGLSVFYQNLTTREPVFFENSTADYSYTNESVEVMALIQFDLKNRLEAGGSIFNEKYQYLSGTVDPGVPRQLDVDKRLVKLIYDHNGLDYFFQYLSGFRNTLNLQYVTSESPALPAFVIGFNDLLYFKRVGKLGNWANRLRLGLASNENTPFAPFAVDNNLNLRGVGNRIDRGTASIVLNTEYRYTLFERKWFSVQGNAFVDAGTWRQPAGDFSDFYDSGNLRVYPGLGVRFMHKRIFNAIFRLDYGWGILHGDASGLVFGIGQYF